MTDETETLVYFGGAVKALGSGKIGGDVAPFGSPSDVDRQLEFFSASTDFGLDISTKARVVYHHGFDKRFGKKRLGVADLALGSDAVKGQTSLDLTDPLHQWLYEQAGQGKLFWSSGSAPHLIEKRAVKGAVTEITSWPIIEVSLTTSPINPKARAYPLKALIESPEGVASGASSDLSPASPASGTLAEQAEACASQAAALAGQFRTVAEAHPLRAAKRDAIKGLIESLEDLYSATAPRPDPAQQTQDEALTRLRRKLRLA